MSSSPNSMLLVVGLVGLGAMVGSEQAPQRSGTPGSASERIAIVRTDPADAVGRFEKLEVTFSVETSATVLHWPYDTAPPRGVPPAVGITAAGEFVDPDGHHYLQPAFHYRMFQNEVRSGSDWHYPTMDCAWKVRFSPNSLGTWRYRIVAEDKRGKAATRWHNFTVGPSASHGFVRVSRADSRYFEFSDGTFFTGLGFELPEYLGNPVTRGDAAYRDLQTFGVNFVRLALGSVYGSAWTPYVGGRNRYNGYLPVAGLVPFMDKSTGDTTLSMRMDYELAGDTRWFDACRLEAGDTRDAVKPRTQYRVSATYRGIGISGPRDGRSPQYGFVVKLGGMFPNCYEPGTSRAVTGHGGNTEHWERVEGTWNSGDRYFMPKLHLALENVREGVAYVKSVSVREVMPDGSDGPEVLANPSLEFQLYVSEAKANAVDAIVRAAERAGVYLKVVVMEKGDEIYQKMADDGTFVTGRDNDLGVYGTGRVVNKTRWLQQAWWRYLQARWGYSPAIHSWELLNEGDPALKRHYEAADEFGKFMHYRVFGTDETAVIEHPNRHMVTTSFWHSFPAAAFWANPQYRDVDYADVHAYVSTSFAPVADREQMQWDAAYYHTWHSRAVAAARVGKPVVRGEAGLDTVGRQDEFALGLQRDQSGVWLHNFLWSGLDAGGLYEIYWWRSHITGPQGDHRTAYRLVGQFLSDLRLNKGGYRDWGGTVSTPLLRVVGQKNVSAGTMHLWVQNAAHTWKNVADGRSIPPVSGTIHVPGFTAKMTYEVEWWDTWAASKATRLQQVTADGSGRLAIEVPPLQADVAVKVRPGRSSGAES